MPPLRTIFFGTPELSADILSYLLDQDTVQIVAIVTNPDQVGGRGHGIIESPVALIAKRMAIPLLQPEKSRDEDFLQNIHNLRPDIGIVVAYGKILPQSLLDIPRLGILNVHTSLLPKYRGPSPIQYALINGEKETGLTIMQMSLGMDEGDILLQERWTIFPSDTTGVLFEKTGSRGGPLLIEAIRGIKTGTIQPIHQDPSQVSYSRYIRKSDGILDPNWTVEEAYHRWQAYTPWPGLYTNFGDIKVSLLEITSASKTNVPTDGRLKIENGKLNKIEWSIENGWPIIQLSNGKLYVRTLLPSGKKSMSGEEFVRGYMQNL